MDFKKKHEQTNHKISLDPSGIDICGNSKVNFDVNTQIINIECDKINIEGDISLNELYISDKLYIPNNGLKENGTVGGIIPKGGIVIWSPPIDNDIPNGWAICDGNLYQGIQTPDLREKFIVGISDEQHEDYANIGESGGANTKLITETNLPSHQHSFTAKETGNPLTEHDHRIKGTKWANNHYGHLNNANKSHSHTFSSYKELRATHNQHMGGGGHFQQANASVATDGSPTAHKHYVNVTYTTAEANATHSHSIDSRTENNVTTIETYSNIPEHYLVIYIMKL
tara:strand:- start:1205 stop:2056 length:852 start_codon:yes stop_codon:yes gene_type:complete